MVINSAGVKGLPFCSRSAVYNFLSKRFLPCYHFKMYVLLCLQPQKKSTGKLRWGPPFPVLVFVLVTNIIPSFKIACVKLFLSQLFYYFYKLEVLNGQKLRCLHLWMLRTRVGLEGRLRRKVQLLPQPAELLFPGCLVKLWQIAPSVTAAPAPETRCHSHLSSESWKVLNTFYETFKW